jgi:hypothetical protein
VNKPLDAYKAKQDFAKTPEPPAGGARHKAGNSQVIQEHAARRAEHCLAGA